MRVIELDRVLDRDDVVVERLVEIVDGRGQGRRLARTGRPGDQHQAAGTHDQVFEHRRRAQIVETQELVGDLPQDHAHEALLLEERDAEAGQIAEREAEVGAALLLELLLRPLRGDALHQGHRVLGLEDLGFQPLHVAVHPQHGRLPDGNVQVARLALDDRVQQFIDENRAHSQIPSDVR